MRTDDEYVLLVRNNYEARKTPGINFKLQPDA